MPCGPLLRPAFRQNYRGQSISSSYGASCAAASLPAGRKRQGETLCSPRLEATGNSGPATSENFLDKEESNLIIKIAGRETCRRNRSRVLRTCAEGASPCRKRMAGFRQPSALGRQCNSCAFQRRTLHACGRVGWGKGRSGAGGTEKKGGARFDRNGPTMAASQKKSRTAGQEGECKSHEY